MKPQPRMPSSQRGSLASTVSVRHPPSSGAVRPPVIRTTRSPDDLLCLLRGAPAALTFDGAGKYVVASTASDTLVLDRASRPGDPLQLPEGLPGLFVHDTRAMSKRVAISRPGESAFWDVGIAALLLDNHRIATESRPEGADIDESLGLLSNAGNRSVGLPLVVARTQALYRFGTALRDRAQREGLDDLVRLETRGSLVVERIQRAGLPIDLSRWRALLERLVAERTDLHADLRRSGITVPIVDQQLCRDLSRIVGRRFDSSRAGLEAIAGTEVATRIRRLRSIEAFINTLGSALYDAARTSADSRVRGCFDSLGATTGRQTCRDPNLLGIPKWTEVRRAIRPGPGRAIVAIDAAAMEVRVAADVLDDAALLAVFDQADPLLRDIHRQVAAKALQKSPTEVTKAERARAKPIVFGTFFGMSPAGMQSYAHDNYGVDIALEDAEAWRDALLDAYPNVREWQARTRRERPSVVTTASGRRGWFGPHDTHQARLAHRIQGTAADALKSALVAVDEALPAFNACLILAPHDELVVECPVERVSEVEAMLRERVAFGFRRYLKRVALEFEVKIGPSWS